MATAAMMHPPPLDGAREHDLTVPCGRIYAVELGEGPLVVLIHDFPEGWWPWRHQLPALGGGPGAGDRCPRVRRLEAGSSCSCTA